LAIKILPAFSCRRILWLPHAQQFFVAAVMAK
jgi:hypothetical protein